MSYVKYAQATYSLVRTVVHIGVDAIDEVVRGHDGPRVGLTDSDFERLEVDLAKRALGYQSVYRHPVRFLLVSDEICTSLA